MAHLSERYKSREFGMGVPARVGCLRKWIRPSALGRWSIRDTQNLATVANTFLYGFAFNAEGFLSVIQRGFHFRLNINSIHR